MRIATWNVNSLKVRLPHVLQFLNNGLVDVLALQELKLEQDKFPIKDIQSAGFHAQWFGQKTYNGVALLSRYPIEDVQCGIEYFDDEQSRVIAGTIQGIRVVDVYCVNGSAIGSDKFEYKREWFNALHGYMKNTLEQYQHSILLGDFNIAPNDNDVYDPEAWRNKILCSDEERSWFQGLLNLGLKDSLRELYPEDNSLYTWWDYRMNGFKRNLGMRIDHILCSQGITYTEGGVDTTMRALERPSDHAPVWLELNIHEDKC